MITREQRIKYDLEYKPNPQWARLDVDYYAVELDTTIPAGTIAQVELYKNDLADLYVNGECITNKFPYDAATLLEE